MTIFKSPMSDLPLRDVSITERLFEGLDVDADRVVLIDGPNGRSLTGAALQSAVRRLAGGLTARGFGAGQTVAILAPNMPEYAVVFHAVAYAGGTITTINPTYTVAEVAHQLKDSQADLMITVPAFAEIAQAAIIGSKVRQIVVIGGAAGFASLDDMMGEAMVLQVPVDLDHHVLALPFSSGTTGLPKGVMLTHRNLVANVDQILQMLPIQRGDKTIAFLPFFHIYGMNVLMNPFLTAGACVVTMPRFDLEAFLTHVQTHRPKLVLIAPPVAIALAKHPMIDKFDVSSIQYVISGAAPLGGEVGDAVAKRLTCTVYQGYGMTELSPLSHVNPYARTKPGSVGISVPNCESRIVNPETGENLGVGDEGELWVRGPQVMLGYLNNSAATDKTKDGDWLKTGDLAVIDDEGYLFVKDRLKELIKVKGFQVAPAEVEAELLGIAGIADAAVIGVPDDEAGEVPMAFVVRSPGADLDADTIKLALRKRLASYKVPPVVSFVDAIPKSASGKILRRVLKAGLTKT